MTTSMRLGSTIDRVTFVEVIREVFARSLVFCDAMISDPMAGSNGEVAIDVSFGERPTAFRVVAPSEEEAYAVLHEMATAMLEVEQSGSGPVPPPRSTRHPRSGRPA